MSDAQEISSNTLVLMNLGTLVTLGGVLMKVVWAWAKADSAMIQMQKDIENTNKLHEKDINAAHARIRDLEKR